MHPILFGVSIAVLVGITSLFVHPFLGGAILIAVFAGLLFNIGMRLSNLVDRLTPPVVDASEADATTAQSSDEER